MGGRSASGNKPACRAPYARLRAKHRDKPAIAIGHVMRKLLHLAFAVWKTNKPFDANHYPWHAPAHLDNECKDVDESMNQAAGLENGAEPIEQEVTAACPATVAHEPAPVD